MKIRLAFVPNSSSSSFIAIFPRKPKTVEELYKWVFGDAPKDESIYEYYEAMTRIEAIKILFKDVCDHKAHKKDILEEFSQRYGYYKGSFCGNDFYQTDYSTMCWGSIPHMVQRIREIHDEEDRITEQHRKEVEAFYKERVPSVPYASEYKDDKGKCRYTKAQIKAYDVYQRKLEELRKTPEYKTLDQKHWDEHRKLWDETRKLEKALSEKDYEKFREQTKGKYVAYITYSDNDGDGMAAMEHGDIWNRIQHIKISHH